MAKRTTTPIKKAPDQPQRICGDCGLAGKADLFNVSHRQFHILRGAKACEKWIPKPIKEKDD